MAAERIYLRDGARGAAINHKLLGTLGMLGAPMLLIEFIIFGLILAENQRDERIVGLLELIYVGGWACSIIGMRQLRVTGDNLLSKIVFTIQMIGLSLAAAFAAQSIIVPNPDPNTLFFRVADIAWPFSHLFMLVVGGLVWWAGVWRGWRRLPAFLCSLGLLVFFLVGASLGKELSVLIFGASTTVGFMSLGYAVRTARQTVAA